MERGHVGAAGLVDRLVEGTDPVAAGLAYANELLAESQQALAGSGLSQTGALAALADMVVRRGH